MGRITALVADSVTLLQGLDQWQDLQNHHNREVRKQLELWSEDVKRFQ